MEKKGFLFLGIGLICSSFLFGISWIQPQIKVGYLNYAITLHPGNSEMFITPFAGPILQDHFRRIQDVSRIEKIIAFGNQLKEKSLIIVGWNISKFAVLGIAENLKPQAVQYKDLLSQSEINHFQQQGYQIYYLPELLEDSKLFHGVDLQSLNGIPISIN